MAKNLIQTWDYRWKLVSMTILIFTLAFIGHPLSIAGGLSASLIVLYLSGISIHEALKSVKPPLILLLFMFPFIIFTPGKELLFHWTILSIYKEGIRLFLTISIKSISIIFVFTTLLYKADMGRMMQSMKAVGIPGKFVSILITTYRYIYLYMDDLGKLNQAAKMRGYTTRKGFSHLLTSADIMLTLLVRSYEQSERVHNAMVLRGFEGEFHSYKKFATRTTDKLISFVILSIAAGLISLELIC